MRRIVEKLQSDLIEFVVQRDDLVLVVRCADPESALVSKMVEGLDESRDSELYWTVLDEFRSDAAFAEACVRSFRVNHDALRLSLQKDGKEPPPPVPPEIAAQGSLPPVERVKQLIVFSRSLLPTLAGCGVVWSLLPTKISDAHDYAAFVSALWQHEFPFPWCHHVRLVVRDTFPGSLLESRIRSAPRMRVTELDLSPDALARALEESASDEGSPLAERVNSVLMLAGIDYGHACYDRAIQQYEIVHRYAAVTQNPTLAAIALNGLGEVHRRQGLLDPAGKLFEAAIAPASQATSPPVPVLFSLYLNLGELRHSQQRWAEAEVFLQGAADFALLMRDPDQRLRCWAQLAECQLMQRKTQEAIETWTNGAVVAHKLAKEPQYSDFLRSIRAHFTRTGDAGGFDRTVKRIAELIAAEPERSAVPATAGAPTAGS